MVSRIARAERYPLSLLFGKSSKQRTCEADRGQNPERVRLIGKSFQTTDLRESFRRQSDVLDGRWMKKRKTDGSGGIWERLHYDWSDPNHIP